MTVVARIWHHAPTCIYVFPVEYVIGPCIGVKITTDLFLFHAGAQTEVDGISMNKGIYLPTRKWDEGFEYLCTRAPQHANEIAIYGTDCLSFGGREAASVVNAYGGPDGNMKCLFGMEIHSINSMMGSGDYMFHPSLIVTDIPM